MSGQGFITEEGLKELDNYKYKPGKYTIMDNIFNYYWEWVIGLVPRWVAPNLLTFVGWVLVLLSYLVMLPYDYTLHKELPPWCFYFAAACIWAYSTLDAIDGKQARRTKSSSPLGQLFDHGCDSFSITFFVLAISQATRLQTQQIFFLFLACQAAFWTANWTEYNTGVLSTNVGQFGVTQAEMLAMVMHLITGTMGQSFWSVRLMDILPYSLIITLPPEVLQMLSGLKLGGCVAYYIGAMLFTVSAYMLIKTIIETRQVLRPIRQWFTITVIIGTEVVWFQLDFYRAYQGLVLMNFGLLSSLIACKLIISSVTKMKIKTVSSELVPLAVATGLMILLQQQGNKEAQLMVFWGFLGVNVISILLFLYKAIRTITVHLGIYCFSLKKRVKKE